MAGRGSYGLAPRLDLQQLIIEAQHRWLRPAEICEIVRNYQKFQIASEAPNRPPSGSLFLFDKKVSRYFRKDGHNWRKRNDGKIVKEAHEKLKVGGVDVLQCYYAHGQENENFQRRSYWSLEEKLKDIVFVHYLEVKGSRTNNSPSYFSAINNKEASGRTDSTSPTSTLSSLYEDFDSADSHQASAKYYSLLASPHMHGASSSSFPHPGLDSFSFSSTPSANPMSFVEEDQHRDNHGGTHVFESQSFPSWEEILQQCRTGFNGASSRGTVITAQPGSTRIGGDIVPGEVSAGESKVKEAYDGSLPIQSNWMVPFESNDSQFYGVLDLTYDSDSRLFEEGTLDIGLQNATGLCLTCPSEQNEHFLLDGLLIDAEQQHIFHSNSGDDIPVEGNGKGVLEQLLLEEEESLKKVDSFSRWANKVLGDGDLLIRSNTSISWSNIDSEHGIDGTSLSPSLSQDQLFSINDFSPKWAYSDAETEVHIVGAFLKSQQEVTKCSWSCMFGEVEVPAEVLADGILCCYAPPHAVGTVPFYITCSNRLACSEVREFDFREGSIEAVDITDVYGGSTSEIGLHMRLDRLLSLRSSSPSGYLSDDFRERHKLMSKIISLKEDDENSPLIHSSSGEELSRNEVKQLLLQKMLREKLYSWLLHSVTESGKASSVLDVDGQGVLHLAAALGYNWAAEPIVTAGVSINFRDANGWTALHWAAFYGREETVAVLVSLGAAPGALTHPSPERPLGRTPADLASDNGHKGISGFLAESFLTSYLSSLTVDDTNADATPNLVQTVSERMATPVSDGDAPEALSLKDSLTAMSNATQAATRIYQVFRMQSFHRKQSTKSGDEGFLLNNPALSLLAGKTSKPVQAGGLSHAAAIQIQKNFRGWKKRKEFLISRQRIVKIQAHFRGHQARKQYRTLIWSVGILEKIVLRWRRKGSGLRGFRQDSPAGISSRQCISSEEDDYDFLKDGRKQAERRTKGALDRVKSMFHHPEGRAQYRRLLTVCEGFRETKTGMVATTCSEEAIIVDEDLDIDSLLEDDAFMSVAFE